jgi:hypothetical protein
MGEGASGLSAGSLSAYSGGTVMASHHLPLTLSSVKLNLPPYDQLSSYPFSYALGRWIRAGRVKS